VLIKAVLSSQAIVCLMPFRESQEATVHRNVVAIAAAPENYPAKKRWELQLVAAKAAQRISQKCESTTILTSFASDFSFI
jgi:hypothetical protein